MEQVNVLPNDEIKYVKTISFSKSVMGQVYTAKIVYKRNPSKDYTMDYSKQTPVEKMLYYYNEDCYPCDIIDKIILNGIRQNYPDARVSTILMLLDVEKGTIEKDLNNYKKEDFHIYIRPDIKDLDVLLKTGKAQWRVFKKKLPIYITNSLDSKYFQNEGLILHYELDKEMIDLETSLLKEVTTF